MSLLPSDRLATIEEVADFLRTTPGALRTQRWRGGLPGSLGLVVGRRLVFRREDVERWLEDQVRAAGAA